MNALLKSIDKLKKVMKAGIVIHTRLYSKKAFNEMNLVIKLWNTTISRLCENNSINPYPICSLAVDMTTNEVVLGFYTTNSALHTARILKTIANKCNAGKHSNASKLIIGYLLGKDINSMSIEHGFNKRWVNSMIGCPNDPIKAEAIKICIDNIQSIVDDRESRLAAIDTDAARRIDNVRIEAGMNKKKIFDESDAAINNILNEISDLN